MKTRLLLLVLSVAGVVTGFLLLRPPSLPSDWKISQSEEIPKRTNASFAPTSALPFATKGREAASSSGEVPDLIRKIRFALKADKSGMGGPAFSRLWLELISKDPSSAVGLAESQEAGPLREEMLRRVAQHWTEQDPVAARRWAEQLPDESERSAALTDVCFQIAQTDARQATQLADQYGLGKSPGATLEDLVQQWAAQDVATATAWVDERPAGEQKNQMLARVAMVLAETSPAEAAQMVVSQIPEGSVQTEAAVSVVYQWARHDLRGARAWVEAFPEGPLRDRAFNELKAVEQNQQAANCPE